MKQYLTILAAFILAACSSPNIDTMVDNEDWDGVIRYCDMHKGDSLRFVDMIHLNLALAWKGELAEHAFDYPQQGAEGLIPEWDKTAQCAMWLSDIYWCTGHVAEAQRMAFEASVCDDNFNPRAIRRLVQTNIVYGNYPVAEKYISQLEKQGPYAGWAKGQRRFLDNDSAVEADALYSDMRACIPSQDFLSEVRGIEEDFKDIVRANPRHRAALEYVGVKYLLDGNFDAFHSLVDEFYGTPALQTLPKSFREAVCMMSETDRNWWRRIGIAPEEYDLYRDFKNKLGAGLDLTKFRNTYWYYVMSSYSRWNTSE